MTYKILIFIDILFFVCSLLFAALGIYILDLSLIIIAVLFALAGLIFSLEMKGYQLNPFID